MNGDIVIALVTPRRMRMKPQTGVRVVEPWSRFVRWLGMPLVSEDKASEGGYVVADLRDGVRRADHVVAVSALAFDHDAGSTAPSDVGEALANYASVVHTTASHEASTPRWRAIIALSRPINVDEHRALWMHAALHLAGRGVEIDASTKDPCRLWYCATVRPGASFEHLANDGEPLNVDAVLGAAKAHSLQRPTLRATPGRYADGALRHAAERVAAAPEGARNATLNREVYSLARLGIDHGVIADALEGAARRAGLAGNETRRTISSALGARRGVA